MPFLYFSFFYIFFSYRSGFVFFVHSLPTSLSLPLRFSLHLTFSQSLQNEAPWTPPSSPFFLLPFLFFAMFSFSYKLLPVPLLTLQQKGLHPQPPGKVVAFFATCPMLAAPMESTPLPLLLLMAQLTLGNE